MPPKKEEKKKDWTVEFGFVILIFIFLWIIWATIFNYLLVEKFGSYAAFWLAVWTWFKHYIWPIILVVSALLSIALVFGIIYNYRKLVKLNEEEARMYGALNIGTVEKDEAVKNERWEKVVTHINSESQAEWRQGIMEADIILSDALKAEGYHGDGVGEMLKGVDKTDLLTLNDAWEAHKVRNMIAHEGSTFALNEREAKRVASLYEKVFRELKII